MVVQIVKGHGLKFNKMYPIISHQYLNLNDNHNVYITHTVNSLFPLYQDINIYNDLLVRCYSQACFFIFW